jgi:hypothetical protein
MRSSKTWAGSSTEQFSVRPARPPVVLLLQQYHRPHAQLELPLTLCFV